MVKRRAATYTAQRRHHIGLPVAVSLPWGKYERHAHLFWRIRALLWLPLLVIGWALARGIGLLAGAAIAILIEAMFSYRKPKGERSMPTPADGNAREEARSALQRWATEAVPSPGGWQPPSGCLPAWNWAPPDGMRPRLDRVPSWVQTWYKTPFVDRYARAWMWRHGGWDVLPPSTS